MEFRQIQTFMQISQVKNFSKAAELLGYSQSAVTVQIRQLETELGVRLFDRTGKKVTLTPSGKEFWIHANKIIDEMYKAKDAITYRNDRIPLYGKIARDCRKISQ